MTRDGKMGKLEKLHAAVEALIHEIDNHYDVDEGIPNISGEIMEKVDALRLVARATALLGEGRETG